MQIKRIYKISRSAKYRTTGVRVGAIVTDPIARKAWADLIEIHGGAKAAITHMLRTHHFQKYIDPES
jgi:hypothetical protein